jgi:LPS sulfotransferase NodH
MTRKTVRFVVLFQGRTGSTYLIEGLNAHPAVRAEGEQLVTVELIGNAVAQLQWVEKYFRDEPTEEVLAVGFKTKLKDVVDPDGFSELLRKHGVSVILMQRRNIIKWVISFFNSVRLKKETGDWNLYRAGERPPPFAIDPEQFDSWLGAVVEKNRLLEEYVTALRLPVLALVYEDLLSDEPSFWKQALSFLDVPLAPVQGKCIKATSDNLREIVANFDELRCRYRGTPFQAMFDEISPM